MTAARLRRRALFAIPLLGVPLLGGGASAAVHAAGALLRTRSQVLMGTRVDLVACGVDEPLWRQASAQAFAAMAQWAAQLSRFDADSAISRVNAQAGIAPAQVPGMVLPIVRKALAVAQATHGAFDPTVGAYRDWHFEPGPVQPQAPAAATLARQRRSVGYQGVVVDAAASTVFLRQRGMALDLGGIAKLPILDLGLDVLAAHGIDHALINGGGDVLVRGQRGGAPWRVGLRDARTPERLVGTLALQGRAVVASSGDYERGFDWQGQRMHHILDPRTGRPTQGVHGVSLLARTVDEVNGLGAALMVMGAPRARRYLAQRHPHTDAVLMAHGAAPWMAASMQAKLAASA